MQWQMYLHTFLGLRKFSVLRENKDSTQLTFFPVLERCRGRGSETLMPLYLTFTSSVFFFF